MNIDNEKIASFTLGALDVSTDAEGYACFSRFTRAQAEYYKRTNPDFYKKVPATSGIRLEFYTDAKAVSLSFKMKTASSRIFFFADMYIDGIPACHCGEKPETNPGEYFTSLCKEISADEYPGDAHTVSIYLPNLASAAIKDFILEGATFAKPVAPRHRIYALGDSITQGYDALYPSMSYVNLTAGRFDAEVLNQAIGGAMFDAESLDSDVRSFSPELITVAYGTNDWNNQKSADDVINSAHAYFKRLRGIFPDTPILYILPIWRDLSYTPADMPTGDFYVLRKRLADTAKKYAGVSVADGGAFVPHINEFYSDGYLHPTDAGFTFYAHALCEYIRAHYFS